MSLNEALGKIITIVIGIGRSRQYTGLARAYIRDLAASAPGCVKSSYVVGSVAGQKALPDTFDVDVIIITYSHEKKAALQKASNEIRPRYTTAHQGFCIDDSIELPGYEVYEPSRQIYP